MVLIFFNLQDHINLGLVKNQTQVIQKIPTMMVATEISELNLIVAYSF